MLLLLTTCLLLTRPNPYLLIFSNCSYHISHQPDVIAPSDIPNPILVCLLDLTSTIQFIDYFKLLIRWVLSPDFRRSVHSAANKPPSSKAHLLFYVLHVIYGLCNKKARLLGRAPIEACHAAIVRRKFLRLSPCSKMRLVIEKEDFPVGHTSCNTYTIFMWSELNAVDTCFRLVPKNAPPLLLGYFFPYFDHTVITTSGNKVFKFRM